MLNGEQIKHYRERIGLTQGQLCKKLGITTSMLSSIERGERRLTGIVENKAREQFLQSRQDLESVLNELDQLAVRAYGS